LAYISAADENGSIFIQIFAVGLCKTHLFCKSAFQPFKVIRGH